MTVQTQYGDITDNAADAGKTIGIASPDNVFALSAGGGSKKVSTIVVDTAANDTAYTYLCNGGTVTFTSDPSGTKLEIAAGLANAHNALAASASAAFAVSDGVDTVTITGREVDDDFSISESDGNLTLATPTAASEGSPIPFGIGVQLTALGTCGLPSLGTAKVMTATPVAVNDATYTMNITVDADDDGIEETYSFSFLADASATIAEIVTGLTTAGNLAMPANSILLTDSTTTLTITSEIAGKDFEATGFGDLGAVVNMATTQASVRDMFQGISMKTQRIETTAAGVAQYAADDTVDVLANGEIWALLDAGQAPIAGDSVFCRAIAGASEQVGAFRTDSDGGDAFLIPGFYWTRPVNTALNGTTLVAGLMARV